MFCQEASLHVTDDFWKCEYLVANQSVILLSRDITTYPACFSDVHFKYLCTKYWFMNQREDGMYIDIPTEQRFPLWYHVTRAVWFV